MKVALTGGTGFIGRHARAALASRGAAVVLASRQPPTDLAIGEKYVQLDVNDAGADAFEQLGSPDVLIHLAWGGLPNYRSLHHLEQELPAQYRFLAGLVRSGLKRIVVTGTCFEYGMRSGALEERQEPSPSNPYALAKDVLRRQLGFLQRERPFELAWARLFYMYGEGQAATSLYPQLRRAAEAGLRVFDMSGGEQLRDYLHVRDVAAALAHLAAIAGDTGIVNICSGEPTSVRRLVEGWIADEGWDIALNLGYYPYPDYEPLAFWGNRTKLDSLGAALPEVSRRPVARESLPRSE